MSYEGMKNKNQKLKEEITELQLKLGECPEGNLNCVKGIISGIIIKIVCSFIFQRSSGN